MQEYLNQIINDKWENVLPQLPDACIDLVLTDPPYNTTDCSWDKQPVNLAELWQGRKRLVKPEGVIVFTSMQPFTADLIYSNREWFRYALVWDKVAPVGHLDAKVRPLRRHEDILVFGTSKGIYNPIMRTGKLRNKASNGSPSDSVYGYKPPVKSFNDQYYPTSIIEVTNADRIYKVHPTQKPVELFQYLIKTYSNPGAAVLDCFAGSGTTAIAAYNTGRNFICIEKDAGYHAKAVKRLQDVQAQLRFDEMVG